MATLRLLLPKTDIDLQVFICCWFVAGEADRDGDGLWPHHQRSLGDDHLPRLEVPGGHPEPPDVRGTADLVGTALRLVDLPVKLLMFSGAVEGHVTASTSLVCRSTTLGADELVRVPFPLDPVHPGGLPGHLSHHSQCVTDLRAGYIYHLTQERKPRGVLRSRHH